MLKAVLEKHKKSQEERRIREEKRLKQMKIENAHSFVVRSFRSFGINNGPIDIFQTSQEELQQIQKKSQKEFYLKPDGNRYIAGMYLNEQDKIMLDNTWPAWSDLRLRHVIAHEYGHRLELGMLGGIYAAANGIDWEVEGGSFLAVPEDVKRARQRRKRRRDMKPMTVIQLDFSDYFGECFAEAVALYITGQVEEKKWFDYTRDHQGKFLSQNKEFVGALERFLHKSIYDNMYAKGLKGIATDIPQIYSYARGQMLRHFREPIV